MFIFALLPLIFLSACSPTRKVIKNPEQHKVTDSVAANQLKSDDLLSLIIKNQPQADWITAKASVNTNIGDNEEGFNINMRLRKDSALWVSINALLGIEAARVLITKDSIKFMDKIHNKYKVDDYEFIREVLNVKLDFNTLQSVLLGNFFNYRNEFKFSSVYVEDTFFILSTLTKHKLKRALEDKDPNKPVIQDFYIDPVTYRIITMKIEDNRIEKSITTNYEQFITTEAGLIPFKNKTEIAADKKISVIIEYSKMNFNEPQSMPFNIPAGYEKME